jgi:hypothetical protein
MACEMQTQDPSSSFQLHANLITTKQLVQRLNSLVGPGNFKIEMRHNIYHVSVNTNHTAAA